MAIIGRNVDIILVSEKALLKILQFEGGVIHGIRQDPNKWNPDEIEIVIEHPDLHKVQDGWILMRIAPTYIDEVKIINGEEFHRIERIDPPKRSS